MIIKADLCVSPHFYSPQSGKRVPSLKRIVNGLARTDLDVVALSSCHNATSGMDNRWEDYLNQAPSLFGEWSANCDNSIGTLSLQNRRNGRKVTLVHTQIIRTYDGESPADLNVFGVGYLVPPSRSIIETAKEVKSRGGVVLVRDPGSRSSATLERALELYTAQLVDGIQVSATTTRQQNEEVIELLREKSVFPFPASNAKRYQDAGTSYAEFDSERLNLKELGEKIRTGEFLPHYGQISRWQVFLSRTMPILLGFPKQFLAGGKVKDELLKATGLKKK